MGHKIALESCIWDCFASGFNKLYTVEKMRLWAFRFVNLVNTLVWLILVEEVGFEIELEEETRTEKKQRKLRYFLDGLYWRRISQVDEMIREQKPLLEWS